VRVRLASPTGIELGPDGLYWGQVLRCGSWDYPDMEGGGFDIDEGAIDEFVRNFAAGEKGPEVLLNYGHDDKDEAGWVKRLEKRGAGEDAQAWAGFTVDNADYRSKVDRGLIRYLSSELDFDYTNPEACRTHSDCTPRRVFEGLALTNRPYVKGMAPIACAEILPNSPASSGCKCGGKCRENQQEGHMSKTVEELQRDLDAANAKLAERDDSTLKAQLADAKRRQDESDRQLRLMVQTNRLDKVRARLKELGRKNVPPVIASRVLRLATALVMGDAASVTLSSKVKVRLADNSGDEELDKLDVVEEVLDMLQELPDAISSEGDADLEEDDTDDDKDKDKKGSESDRVKSATASAKKRMSETKGLRFEVVLAEELAKRGIKSALAGGKR